jgi:hypothetical protein
MEALARIGVLEQVRAVEGSQSVGVGREVRRHPVEDHADAGLVQHVDQVHQVLRRAVARGRREVAGGLVAPGAVERMLRDRQQLDVRESAFAHMVGERMGDVAIGRQHVVAGPAPRAEMQFVDRDGRRQRGAVRTLRHPAAVVPCVLQRPGARGRRRWNLAEEAVRVGLVERPAVAGDDPELVRVAVPDPVVAAFPHAGGIRSRGQAAVLGIPAVPVTDDRNAGCVGGPDADLRTVVAQLASQLFVQAGVRASRNR